MKTETYQFVSNDKVFDTVTSILMRSETEFSVQKTRCGPTKVQWKYTLTDCTLKLFDDDILPQIIVTNAETPGTALRISVGFYRMICTNGLTVGTDVYSTKIIHRKGETFDRKYNEVADQIDAAIEYLNGDFVEDMTKATEACIYCDDSGVEIIGNLNVPTKTKDKAIRLWLCPDEGREEDWGNSVWNLWNIVNEQIRFTVNSQQARIFYNKNLLRDINDLNESIWDKQYVLYY